MGDDGLLAGAKMQGRIQNFSLVGVHHHFKLVSCFVCLLVVCYYFFVE